MLAIRLPSELEQRLTELAQKTGRSKSYYVRKAITEFLEDEEDYFLALTRLEENNPRISLEEIKRLVKMES